MKRREAIPKDQYEAAIFLNEAARHIAERNPECARDPLSSDPERIAIRVLLALATIAVHGKREGKK